MSAPTPRYPTVELDVPEGESGEWKIEKFTLDGDESIRRIMDMIDMRNGNGSRFCPNGTYYRLKRDGKVIMSNTPAEVRDHKFFAAEVRQRGGHVLINGLGLGVALEMIMEHAELVTVVERSTDVIRLSGTHYLKKFAGKLEIVHADAFDYRPPKGARYTCVWHDIWDKITADNLPEMGKLHRKYGKRCDWQDSWCKGICQRESRRWKRALT